MRNNYVKYIEIKTIWGDYSTDKARAFSNLYIFV
ncbi:unnamed protein product [Tenebrio molitor]|nr:unnamed protein product [Tenebrio molitor]